MALTQNLNSKLGPDPRRAKLGKPAVRMGESPIRSSTPPVRIVGVSRRYQGGYRVNV